MWCELCLPKKLIAGRKIGVALSKLISGGHDIRTQLQLCNEPYWFGVYVWFSFRRYGPNYDLAARRKNATRESTATLKAWLSEHKKNPYPTKGEKIMLAIITKMTLTQVSTWFANARRRLKKENKMTWEPKNKTEDDDDGMMSDDEKEKDAGDGGKLSTEAFGESKCLPIPDLLN